MEFLRQNTLWCVEEGERFPELKGIEHQVFSLARLYGHPKHGCFRITFDCGDYVLKVPYNRDGIACNAREANWRSEEIPLAKCELVPSPIEGFGVLLLKMEKVEEIDYTSPPVDLPSWVESVDCRQVGYNSAKNLVAYDL